MFWKCSPSFNTEQLSPCLSVSLPSICTSLSGVVSLSQALCSSDDSNSLLHLDLSKNPGVLSGEDASVRKHNPSGNKNIFKPSYLILMWSPCPLLFCCLQNLYLFLSQPNCLVHLDLSGTDCSVDSVSVSWHGMTKCLCATLKLNTFLSVWFSGQFNRFHPVSHAAIRGSSEGVLCWSLFSESFQKFLLPQVSHTFKIT